MKGFYSVIQYCPDPSRGEAANVGVVLLTEAPKLVVKTSTSFARVKQFFKPSDSQLDRIIDAVRASGTRLLKSSAEIRTLEDLSHFAQTMGNDIRLSPPLVIRVDDVQNDLVELYAELVSDDATKRSRRSDALPDSIESVFRELRRSKKVTRPGRVKIPQLGLEIRIPYAYRNGILNYVKPALFIDDSVATEKASRLAIEGDQIRKHPLSELHGTQDRRLIVVSSADSDPEAEKRVAPLFGEYGVKYVTQAEASQFAARVLQEAK